MSQKYSSDQKAAIMMILERSGGDIQFTAQQTGIAENTIYAWQRSIRPFFQQNPLPPQYPAELPAVEGDLEMLAFIRKQIMDEMIRISTSLRHDSGITTPYQRVLVLSQLMDKMMKLDQHLHPYVKEQEEVEIRYVLSDDVEPVDDDY